MKIYDKDWLLNENGELSQTFVKNYNASIWQTAQRRQRRNDRITAWFFLILLLSIVGGTATYIVYILYHLMQRVVPYF